MESSGGGSCPTSGLDGWNPEIGGWVGGSLYTPEGVIPFLCHFTTKTVYKQPRSRRYSFSKEF